MEEDKDFVGMSSCFFCGEVKELMLDRRLKKSFPKSACYNKEPCDNCKKVMKQGVLFIAVRDGEQGKENPYRTGQIIGLKEKAVKEVITEPLLSQILKSRVCFVELEVLKQMGLVGERGGLKYKKKLKA